MRFSTGEGQFSQNFGVILKDPSVALTAAWFIDMTPKAQEGDPQGVLACWRLLSLGLLTAVCSISVEEVASAKATVLGVSPKRRENHDKNRVSEISGDRSLRWISLVRDRLPLLAVSISACI